jgi:hypothetical protein
VAPMSFKGFAGNPVPSSPPAFRDTKRSGHKRRGRPAGAGLPRGQKLS